MAKFLYRTGRFCAAHALYVLLAWIVLAIGLTVDLIITQYAQSLGLLRHWVAGARG